MLLKNDLKVINRISILSKSGYFKKQQQIVTWKIPEKLCLVVLPTKDSSLNNITHILLSHFIIFINLGALLLSSISL